MSNKKNKNKLDIIQGQSPLYVLFLNNNEGCTNMHVEDIAISVKEIFPSFFSWSKHKERIDLRQVMRSMDKLKDDGLITGSNTTLWSLTSDGFNLSKKIFSFDVSNSSKPKRSAVDFYSREINRLTSSDAFIKYTTNNSKNIKDAELKYLFRIDAYNMDKDSLVRNKERLYIASSTNKEITVFLNKMTDLLFERKIIKKGDLDE